MQKKTFITVAMVVTVCCFSMFLSGCFSNKGAADVSSPAPTAVPNSVTKTPNTTPPAQTTTSTPTTPPNSATQTPDSEQSSPVASPTPVASSTPTTTSKAEEQTPESTSTNQTDPTADTTGINTGLPDGTKVKLIISGQAIYQGIIMGEEVLVADYTYTFGQLTDAGGIESAGFWALSILDVNSNIETATISNSLNFMDTSNNVENGWYTIKIVEGEYSFTCNDEIFLLTVPAQTIDGWCYVPLVALAEAINATVEWDEAAQAINFFYK